MIRRAAALLALAIAAALPAQAQEQPSAPKPEDLKAKAIQTLDALFPKGETICFARFYDAAHLKRHPKQTVTSVRLTRGFQDVRSDHERDADLVYSDLIVTYRSSGARRFRGGASCRAQDDGTIMCSADSCDGGSFPLKREDADTIAIGGEAQSHFTVSGGCGGGEDRSLTEGEDDRFFRLKRAPITACR